ncbi:carboxypeptidase-like regulatory domain-containing protein [Acidaminobacter sp. JC074]|uniref:carboxypeptidase-like regulatory domain-containing protein n=1 Tax=Acidaminobacter sp. JC074 TaxID=2530199 RepID=UPI001F0E95BA|nr:carboxypeptidase-like regulatory domain-containing protein [Acidaminobacter sp. JC074]
MKKILSLILLITTLMSTFVYANEVEQTDVNALVGSINKIHVVISGNDSANERSRNEYSNKYTSIYLPQKETVDLAVTFEGIEMDGYQAVYKDGEEYKTFGSFTTETIADDRHYADKRMDVYIQKVSDSSVARVGQLVVYSFRDKLGHVAVKDADGQDYDGRVNYTLLDGDDTLYNYSSEAIGGNMVVFLPEGAATNDTLSIIAYPERSDFANTQVTSLSPTVENDVRYRCGEISFQTPETTVTLKDDQGNNVSNISVRASVGKLNASGVTISTYPDDKLHLASFGSDYFAGVHISIYQFASGNMNHLKTGDVSIGSDDVLWTLDGADDGNQDNGDQNNGGDNTPTEKQLHEKVASITPIITTNDQPTPGSKFYTSDRKRSLYISVPEGSNATSKLELEFRDENGDILDIGDAVIDIRFNDGHASEPSYNKDTKELTVYPVSGGYADQFGGNVFFDDNHVPVGLHIVVYKGKLGELQVSSPDGLYEGNVNYLVGYKGDKGQSGSNTNAHAYNGILPIPVMNGLLDVEYAFVLLWPGEKVNDKVYANAEYKDFTNIMGNSELIFDMGSADFQEPEYTATVVNEDGSGWNQLVFGVESAYQGQNANIIGAEASSISAVGNVAAFASFGEDFSNTFELKYFQYNKPEKINMTVDISTAEDETVEYVEGETKLQGNMLKPDGNPIPNGQGRDVHVKIEEITENSRVEIANYVINTGSYKTSDLVDGKKYRIDIHPDPGDFDDLFLTAAPWVELIYHDTPGDYQGIDEFGETVNYTVDQNGLITLDIKMTEAFLKGQVLLGGVATTDHINVTLMKGDEVVVRASTYSSTVPGTPVNKSGVFVMGGIKVEDGDYKLIIGEPETSLQYAGTVVDITLPHADFMEIELPKNKVYGKMVVLAEHQAKYENKFRRTYVNIYNEFGEYVTNGRVREDGLFGVSDLDTGRYYAQAFVTPYAELAADYASSERVAFVVDDSGQSNFDVPLIRKIARGNVTLANGQPLVKGWVLVYDASGDMVYSASTDDSGNYVLAALADGAYKVKALGEGGDFDSPMSTFTITNDSVNNENALDLRLTQAQVTGSIQKDDAMSIDVIVYDDNKQFVTVVKAEDTSFSLGGLLSGKYYIQAVPNASASDTSSEMVEFDYAGNPLTQDLALGTSDLTGTVKLPDGNVLEKGWVKLYKDGLVIATSQISTEGTFKFGNLEDGVTYQVQVDNTKGYYKSEKLDVIKGTNDVEILLRNQASVKGIINLNGKVLDLQKVFIYKDKNPVTTVMTNAFGEFSVCDLEEGTYEFVVVVDEKAYVFTKTYSGSEVNAGTVSLE